MKDLHPHSPEERRKRLARLRARFGKDAIERAKRDIKPLLVAKRVAIGVYDDGFIHAGNLAYLVASGAVSLPHPRGGRRPAVRPGRRTRS